MFTSKNGRIEVFETQNGYYIKDTGSGEVRGMGDGVDMFEGLTPGTKSFNTALRREVKINKWRLLEGYFGVTREQARQDHKRKGKRWHNG